ncbi:DoxX family protein [Sinomicrobium soli]|uniref:DoxX family protein n=1 Tax=Sinomicrobium sp. N-1-3-6 TaxID=2219864 RepID=UPI000DCCC512|nr:DoxX family protein [Sinomicrobium sp. N-1-3-6]RAV28635.1 DoxX family protein [Sinomicrobium sp. N-1-3-6]
MKTNKIIFWITTAIISLMMLFSAFQYLTNPDMIQAFTHLGYPSYFRVELAIAKMIGAVLLLIPALPRNIKEWVYAGFGIVFITAAISHGSSGDPVNIVVMPLIFLLILIVSYVYFHKLHVKKDRSS